MRRSRAASLSWRARSSRACSTASSREASSSQVARRVPSSAGFSPGRRVPLSERTWGWRGIVSGASMGRRGCRYASSRGARAFVSSPPCVGSLSLRPSPGPAGTRPGSSRSPPGGEVTASPRELPCGSFASEPLAGRSLEARSSCRSGDLFSPGAPSSGASLAGDVSCSGLVSGGASVVSVGSAVSGRGVSPSRAGSGDRRGASSWTSPAATVTS